MAIVSIFLKNIDSSTDGLSPLVVRVEHAGRRKQLHTGIRLPASSLPEPGDRVVPASGVDREAAQRINAALRRTTDQLSRRVSLLETSGHPFTVEEICDGISFEGEGAPQDLFCFFRLQSELKAAAGKYATHQLYAAVLHSLRGYSGVGRFPFGLLSRDFVSGYLACLSRQGLCSGTISKYMAVFRTVCFRAVCRGVSLNREQLFSGVRRPVGATAKRAVDKSVLSAISQLDLGDSTSLRYATDLFLFSFFARGMSLVDILHLRSENVCGGRLRYYRAKCGTQITLAVTPQMQSILDRYRPAEGESDFLFPTLRGFGRNAEAEYRAYRATLRATNRALSKISDMMSLEVPLTTYVARHTWATNAKKSRIPIPVIQEALGHTSIRTTEIYLQHFETGMIDRINERLTQL